MLSAFWLTVRPTWRRVVGDRVACARPEPVARLGVMRYGLPATVAVFDRARAGERDARDAVAVDQPPAPVVNSLPVKVKVEPYVLVWSVAVMLGLSG